MTRIWQSAGLVALVILLAVLAFGMVLMSPREKRAGQSAAFHHESTSPASMPSHPSAKSGQPQTTDRPFSASMPSASHRSVLDDTRYGKFRGDGQGRLMIDVQTRDTLDRILALHERDQAQEKIRELSTELSPLSRRQLQDLFHRYQQYAATLRQSFTPGDMPGDERELLKQLDHLQDLRIEHFGAGTAHAMFGPDEQVARRLIELMQQNIAPGLSLEQKAEQAQQAYDQEQTSAKPLWAPPP